MREKKALLLFPAMMLFSYIFIIGIVGRSMTVSCAEWSGVDETVVEKYAKEYGRSAREPFINTDQGDILLFVFCLAGTIGGFVMGYSFHKFFHEPQEVLPKVQGHPKC
jgi:ABC-type cobalt transport system substrate-binding protein